MSLVIEGPPRFYISLMTGVALVATFLPADSGSAAEPRTPEIVATYRLEDLPLPLPDDARPASRSLGFRFGGISDLVAGPPDAAGRVTLWGITDRGPNGFIERAESSPLRTLPIPEFSPLIVRMSLDSAGGDGEPGILCVEEVIPIRSSAGGPTSGRPAVGPPLGKTMVDPASARPLEVDPDGLDSEGLALADDGGFWVAEEYAPSLVRLAPDGRMVTRLVPEGSALEGAGCDVIKNLPASLLRRQDNRGFESLTTSRRGERLIAMLQSPLVPIAEAGDDSCLVPLLILDAGTGEMLAQCVYPLGAPGESAETVAAADGKISAIAAADDEHLLILEQSVTASRIYEVEISTADLPHPDLAGTPVRRLGKRLVADLAGLVPTFHSALVAGAEGLPARFSDLKFEGLAILGPGLVALINDNDFDMDAAGAAPAVPPVRSTVLWVLRIDPLTPQTEQAADAGRASEFFPRPASR